MICAFRRPSPQKKRASFALVEMQCRPAFPPLLRFTDPLKGALYHDVTAIICDNGFELVDISRLPAVLGKAFERRADRIGEIVSNEIQQRQSASFRLPIPLSPLFQPLPARIVQSQKFEWLAKFTATTYPPNRSMRRAIAPAHRPTPRNISKGGSICDGMPSEMSRVGWTDD